MDLWRESSSELSKIVRSGKIRRMRFSDEAQHEESVARRLLSIGTEISFLEGHEVLGGDSRVGRAPFCCLIALLKPQSA